MYIDYLLELSEESSFVEGSKTEIQRLQTMVKDYVYSSDLTYTNTSSSIEDNTAYWCSNYGKYKLLSGDENTNYFKAKSKSIADYTEAQVTFNLNAPDGKIVILIDNNGIPHSDEYFLIGKSKADLYDFYNSIYCEGYNFEYWYDVADGGTLVSTMPSGKTTLYAHWSPKQTFTVTFDANGGTIIGESSVIFYEGDSLLNMPRITTPIKAEKENEFFWGWYDSSSGGKEVDTITENMTVYAQYKTTPRLYEYWIDDSSVTHLSFAFNPKDFGLSAEGNYTVIHAWQLSGWGESTVKMTKGVDGIYRCEYTSDVYPKISAMWPGYKFIIVGKNSEYIWIGAYDYKYRSHLTAGKTYEDSGDCNFLIKELMVNY